MTKSSKKRKVFLSFPAESLIRGRILRITAVDDFNEDEDVLDSAETHTRLLLRMEEDDQAGQWNELIERAKSRSHHWPSNYNADDYMLKEGDGLWEIGCKVRMILAFR